MKICIPFLASFYLVFCACNSSSDRVELKEDKSKVVVQENPIHKDEKQVSVKKERTYEEVVKKLNESNNEITKLGNEINELLKGL